MNTQKSLTQQILDTVHNINIEIGHTFRIISLCFISTYDHNSRDIEIGA